MVAKAGEIAMLEALEMAWYPNMAMPPAAQRKTTAQVEGEADCRAGRAERTKGMQGKTVANASERRLLSFGFIYRSRLSAVLVFDAGRN
jgi:hypothetical protein